MSNKQEKHPTNQPTQTKKPNPNNQEWASIVVKKTQFKHEEKLSNDEDSKPEEKTTRSGWVFTLRRNRYALPTD